MINLGIASFAAFSMISCVKAQDKPNILLIVADALNYNSVGAFGCPVPGTTPNLDKLADEGLRFTNAHVNIAVCQPSRGVIMTGMYGHQTGVEGFEPYQGDKLLTLTEYLRNAGYETGMLGKIEHSMPKYSSELQEFAIALDQQEIGMGRDPQLYYKYTREFISLAQNENKPFFFMVNSRDPHRPFAGSDDEKRNQSFIAYEKMGRPIPDPSKIFIPDEITVPGFLPDLPDVRKEIAQYYSSVRRLDDMVGLVLNVLKELRLESNTLIIFI